MFKRFKFIFVLSLPLLCKYAFLLLFVDWNLFELEDVLEDLLFFTVIVLLLSTYLNRKQFFIDVICLTYLNYLVLETTSYLAVSSNFTSSFMYLLIESNSMELKEFYSSYIDVFVIVFIILAVFFFFVLRKIRIITKYKYSSLLAVFGTLVIVLVLKITGLIESNAYHNIVRGTYGYFELHSNVKYNSNFKKEELTSSSNNDVLVVVLGESTSRGHMQLYGYKRETNPRLNSIKDSLYIYNDVISTDVITTKALPLSLTSAYNGSKELELINLIDVFNALGYKTYWLSNQRPIGYYDNKISKIASSANYVKYLNHRDEVNTTSYDEVLLPEFNAALKDEGKKVIFIRLIGTHFKYENRYPIEFDKFNNYSNKTQKSQITNHYDNAVYYNDYVVWSILNDLKSLNCKSAMLYMSDHGENVFDNGTNFFGRTEANLKQVMFEIPFILWTSENFEFPTDFEYNSKRKFMADHTYESIGHIFGVLHKSMDTKKSIFSDRFKDRKRLVLNGLDYDEFFVEKNE